MHRAFASVFLVILSLATIVVPSSAADPILAFRHVNVIDATGSPVRPDMTVLVEGQRIVDLGKSGDVQIPKGAKIVDAAGKFLIPGLWDMHVHTIFGDWIPKDENIILPLFVANGVTGVRDMGSDLEAVKQWRSQIAAGKLLGPRMIVAGPMLDGPTPRFPSSVPVSDSASGRKVVDDLRNAGVDFIKIQSLVPRDGYFAAASEANKLGITFVGHVPDAVRASEASMLARRHEHFTGVFEGCSTIEDQLLKGRRTLGQNVATFNPERAKTLIALFAKNQTWRLLPWHGNAVSGW